MRARGGRWAAEGCWYNVSAPCRCYGFRAVCEACAGRVVVGCDRRPRWGNKEVSCRVVANKTSHGWLKGRGNDDALAFHSSHRSPSLPSLHHSTSITAQLALSMTSTLADDKTEIRYCYSTPRCCSTAYLPIDSCSHLKCHHILSRTPHPPNSYYTHLSTLLDPPLEDNGAFVLSCNAVVSGVTS